MGLFSFLKRKPKVEEENIMKMADNINFEQLVDARDEILTALATKIINDEPLIVNLEVLDVDNSNKVMAFLSGVVYTLDGEVHQIQDKIYMFANKGVYDDGSMKVFLNNLT